MVYFESIIIFSNINIFQVQNYLRIPTFEHWCLETGCGFDILADCIACGQEFSGQCIHFWIM